MDIARGSLRSAADLRVFVSYRRDDTAGYAGRLADDLAERLGPGRTFFDVDRIRMGQDFETAIRDAIERSTVVLVLIGPTWLGVRDEGGRRIDRPMDFVRLEVATALSAGKIVVPVLLGGAAMPARDDLPDEIAALATRQAIVIDHKRWRADVEALTVELERLLTGRVGRASRSRRTRGVWPATIGLGVSGVLLLAIANATGFLGRAVTPSPSVATTASASGSTTASATGPSASLSVLAVPTDASGMQAQSAELVAGARYEMAITRPRTRFTIPGPGWIADRDYADGFNLAKAEPGDPPYYPSYFTMGFVQVVYDGPCGDSPTHAIEQEPRALAEFLEGHPTVTATPARPINFGGYSGLSTELTIAEPPAAGTCTIPEEISEDVKEHLLRRTYLFLFGEDVFHISPGEHIRVVAVGVGDRLILLMYGTILDERWDTFSVEAEALLQSVEFAP